RVLAVHGDTHLGGDDIDNLLIRIGLEDIASEWGTDVSRNQEAVQLLRRAVIQAKEKLSFVPVAAIDFEFQGRRYQRELTRPYYEALAARYPDDPSVLYEAGTQLGTLGHPEAALGVHARARALAPGDFRVALHHALALRATGDARGAVAALEGLRRQRWDAPLVHQNLGALLLDAGEPGVASGHLRTALELEPGSASARLALAEARLAAGDPGGTRELLETLVAGDQGGAEAHALLARAALALGDCPAARLNAERSRRLDPTVGGTHRLLAEALECLGDARGAEAAYAAALGAEPADPVALGRLGVLLVRRGEVASGLARLVAALELAPDSAELAAELGVALRRAGRPAEAVGALCLALRLAPGLPVARRELLALGADEGACASSAPPAP
ncbi:MAG TPA: tetratricopeptide repeat protein, partial [Polyangiaceae bacterium]|nr:tetratricopeptide repeat protein [Polyangiaceae bacterium]